MQAIQNLATVGIQMSTPGGMRVVRGKLLFTQIEVGGARDESSCLRVGSVGEHLFLEGFWCLFRNKRMQYS